MAPSSFSSLSCRATWKALYCRIWQDSTLAGVRDAQVSRPRRGDRSNYLLERFTMLIQELFRRVVAGRGQLLQDIATMLVPRILQEFAAIPALGGSGQPSGISDPELEELLTTIPSFTPEELQIFSTKGFDQSLATHLINGLFAGMFLAERLPEHKTLKSIELQVWALGYTVHDYTKAYGRKVSAGQLAIARQLVSKLGERLAFDCFMEN